MCWTFPASCLFALTAIFAVSGCKSTPTAPQPVPVQTVPSPVDTVQSILASADAASEDLLKARYYLEALQHLHTAGDLRRARQIAQRLGKPLGAEMGILVDVLSEGERFRFRAIALDLAIDEGNDTETQRLLAALRPTGPHQARQVQRLKARVQSATGNHARAADTLIALAHESTDESDVGDLTASIWHHLSSLSVLELAFHGNNATNPWSRAWWMLARDFNAATTSRGQATAWQHWRARYPRHLAARFPPPALARMLRDPRPRGPRRIALLVPLSGDFGAAGEAVRDGFLAAYLHAGTTSGSELEPSRDQPATAVTGQPWDGQEVRVYDTGAMSVRAAYDLALQEGAEVIVGPLEKSAVAALAALSPTLPTIALNHLDTASPVEGNPLIQFALAVEDQASAIAEALTVQGIERIVLFDSPARWSSRARARFEAELGSVEAVGFGTFYGVEQVTAIVGDALHIAESQARAREVEAVLGARLEFTARRRDDVDAVVALIDAQEFLSLMPALAFHFAGDLPVYGPSSATLGEVDLSRLEGLRMPTIPWILDSGGLGAAVYAAFPASRGVYGSLFALGVDGFRLANQLVRLTVRRETIPGSTGVLSLGDDGRIRRELVWARVSDGSLLPVFGDQGTDIPLANRRGRSRLPFE